MLKATQIKSPPLYTFFILPIDLYGKCNHKYDDQSSQELLIRKTLQGKVVYPADANIENHFFHICNRRVCLYYEFHTPYCLSDLTL